MQRTLDLICNLFGNEGRIMLILSTDAAVDADRSEGFPRTGYFVPGRDGTGAWRISGVVRVTARAYVVFFEMSVFFLSFF